MIRLTTTRLLQAAAVLTVLSASPALAAGGESEPTQTCPSGQVYNQQKGQCEQQSGAVITDQNRADYAYALAKEGRYQEALSMLDTIKDQNTAEVLNYRGFATRKLGRTDEGIGYYLQSVKLDPTYVRVREYLGEAYVVKGRLDLAREQLTTIRSLCGTTCEEYRDLDEMITKSVES